MVPNRADGAFLRRLDPFLYGNGLCFGMVVAALHEFSNGTGERRLSELDLSPELLDELLAFHARQYRPRAVIAVVLDWLKSGGGKPGGVTQRLRLPESGDPHIICFGPAVNRSFLRCMRHAHSVAPYGKEELPYETRVHVYDPNHPKDRNRYVSFGRNGGFWYGGFSTKNGWGVCLLPLSKVIPAGGDLPEARPR